MRKSSLIVALLSLVVTAAPFHYLAFGAAGALDPTFGNGGITMTKSANGFSLINAVRVQSDGEILVQVEAPTTNEILRYTTTGTLDTGFGTDGIASVIGGNMALAAGDQIVVGAIVTDPSNSQIAMAVERLNSDGTRDSSFANGGMALADLGSRSPLFYVVLAEPDGSVLMCSSLLPAGRRQPSQTALAHFTSTGELDSTFGNGGVTIATAAGGCSAIALLKNSDILVVDAQDVAQFTSSGSLKPTVTGGRSLSATRKWRLPCTKWRLPFSYASSPWIALIAAVASAIPPFAKELSGAIKAWMRKLKGPWRLIGTQGPFPLTLRTSKAILGPKFLTLLMNFVHFPESCMVDSHTL